MTFKRSLQGLSNQYLFYNVDIIVFVEGRQSFSLEEVQQGKYSSTSADLKFWKKIFLNYFHNLKFKFKSVGSKSILKQIATAIYEKQINNVYVAMDREFDGTINEEIKTFGVFYTYGYSWENDVWNSIVIQEVLKTISDIPVEEYQITKEVQELLEEFLKDIYIGVCADAYLFNTSKTFFNRDKHLCCLIFGKKIKPKVDKKRIFENLRITSLNEQEMRKFGYEKHLNAQRDCLGHLLADFCYWVIVYEINQYSSMPQIAKDYLNYIAIDIFSKWFVENEFPLLKEYYEHAMVKNWQRPKF